MDRQILIQRASEVEALINNLETTDFFKIRAHVDDATDKMFFIFPAEKYNDSILQPEKIIAWASLNRFSPIFSVRDGKPCIKLVSVKY